MSAKSHTRRASATGSTVERVRRLLLGLSGVTEGRSYSYPSFLVNGRFFARFRDHDTVLVLQLATIDDRDFLMDLDPRAFSFTEHYRNYPAVLIRLADISAKLLATVVEDAWHHASALPPPRRRAKNRRAP